MGRAPSGWIYTTDVFFGVRWRWQYAGGQILGTPTPYCVRDEIQLVVGSDTHCMRPFLECETCTERLPLDQDPRELKQKVIRQIDRKVRSDEWNDTVRTERRRRSAAEN